MKLQASFIYIYARMSNCNFMHENFHTKHGVSTAPDAHMHTSLCQLHIMSIQPANKAEKHLISSLSYTA